MLNRQNRIKIETNTSAADVIEETMIEKRLTVEQLASLTGLSIVKINHILTGQEQMNYELAMRFETGLGINHQLLINMDHRK